MTGPVTVGDEEIAVEGQGQRDHSWGERDWWAFRWCWAAGPLDDGTRVHLTNIRLPDRQFGVGYVQRGERSNRSPMGRWSRSWGRRALRSPPPPPINPAGWRVTIVPIAFGPVILESPDGKVCRFPRALARFTAQDGRSGLGWVEGATPAGWGRSPAVALPRR